MRALVKNFGDTLALPNHLYFEPQREQ